MQGLVGLAVTLTVWGGLLIGPWGLTARGDEPRQRLQHLRQAAEHLAAAGLEREARDLMERAEHLERELHGRHRPDDVPHAILEQLTEMRKHLHELTREVQTLREEVRQLRKAVPTVGSVPPPSWESSVPVPYHALPHPEQPTIKVLPNPYQEEQTPRSPKKPTLRLIVPSRPGSDESEKKATPSAGAIIIGKPSGEDAAVPESSGKQVPQ